MSVYKHVHLGDKIEVKYVGCKGMPKYRTPNGGLAYIEGNHHDTWRYPKILEDADGRRYVEMPEYLYRGWGITFHAVRPTRNPIARFFKYYVEGRASGFPFWPVLHFSMKNAVRRRK